MSICKRGHIIEYTPGSDSCKHCKRAFYLERRIQILETSKARYANKKPEIYAKQKIYNAKNKGHQRQVRAWWEANNTDKILHYSRVSYAKRKHRIPCWLTSTDIEKIQVIYKIRANLSILDGIQYHVDHIIPLQGKTVSGLHVPNNLQIISAQENMLKKNRHMETYNH